MTASQIRGEIDRLVTDLIRHGLAISGGTTVLKRTGDHQIIRWSGGDSLGIRAFPSPGFGTLSQYRRLVRSGDYSCLLADGAVLQLSYIFRRDEVIKHRLAYVPSPYSSSTLDEADEGGTDIETLVGLALEAEAEAFSEETFPAQKLDIGLRLGTPLRFDFDSGAAR